MWFLKHRKTGTKGFSLVEIIVVMTIVSVLVAIAVPTALQQRKKSSDAAMKADALQIATGMQNALQSWNGTPPADVPLTFATPTWSITYGANTIVSGSVSTGDVVSGTIWADGSYCAQVVNSSGSNNWIIRSDTGQLTSGTCPSTALGGLGSLPTSTTVTLPGAPGNLSVINTLGVDNSIDVFWSAVAGATSYLVNVTGITPVTVTAPSVSTNITNIPGGDTTVSVRAVNASGSGQASATNITVLGGTLFSTGVTTPLTAGSGSATLERVQIGTTGLGLGGTSLTSDASTIKFGTNASSATAAWIAGRTDGGVNFYTQSAGGSIINNLSLTPTVNTFNNNLSVSASTTSTSSTTGALTVTGGTGVGGNLYVGGNLVLTGTCTGCSGGAATITDDTATNATYYPALSLTTTGTLSAVKTSSTKLSFNPSSGILTASAISSGSGSQLGTTYNILKTNNPSFPALITQGAVSQTADIVQFQDSGANILARVDAYGNGAFANHNASRVKVATTVALASPTYANGTSGVGATLTESTNGILAGIDAYTPVVGDRILVKNQATTFQNGIYSVTSIGAAGAPWVLTRSTDSDTAAKIAIGFIGVDQGATNTGTFWNTNFTSANTVGTTALTYAAFTSGSGAAITVTDDTTTNATYYPSLSLATSGTLSAVKTSSTKLSFNPSTGLLTTSGLTVSGTSTLNGTLNVNTGGTGTINLGDGTITKVPGSGFNFNGGINNVSYLGVGSATGLSAIPLYVTLASPTAKTVIQGAASQTANLQEWQNSAGTVLASVAADGTLATNFLTALGGAGTYPYLALSSNSIVLNTRNAAYIGLVVQGTASQTADLLQIKNSSGTVVSRIASGGGIEAANGIFAGYGSYAAFSAVTTAGFLVGSPGNPGLIVRGATAQTADLLQLQNSSGSSLVKVDAYGQLYSVQQQITQTNAGAIPLQITGAPLQTADLLQIKNNAGTLLANVDALGNASFANHYSSRVKAASTASLTVTYSNGTAGVGATLTNAGAQVAFAIDGYTAVVGDRILIKDQATGFQNGIYTVANIGSGATNWILTRSTDSDTASKLAAGLTAVDKGIANTGTYWKTSFSSTNIIGTDGMTWTPFTSGTGAAATITDDNSTNASYYLTLSTTNTGSLSAIKTSSAKLTFNPSTGVLSPSALTVTGAAIFNGSLTVNGNTDKVRVRIATAVAGTLATSFANSQTVDGVTLATGDRILIKNQATTSENGIYTVNASGAPTRATDADAASKVSTAFVAIDQGTTLSGTYWYTTFKSTDTVGTTGMNWVAFGTGGGAYTAPTLGSTLIPSGATVSIIAGLTLTTPVISTITNTGTLTLPTSTDTLVGRNTTDTLTNKTISGGTNTITGIVNASLVNSSLTIGSTSLSLGATVSTIAGLTLTSPTLTTPALGVATATSINGTIIPGSSTLMVNPMTTQGDLTYGGASGAPTRLPGSATNNYVLTYNTASNTPFWSAPGAGYNAPTIGSTLISSGATVSTIAGLTLTSPNLGTPSAAVLTNATGLPISTGVSGLGTGVASLLSGNATGTGSPVGSISPTLTTPAIGVASGTSLTTTSDSSFSGVTFGAGGSGIATNLAAGAGALTANATAQNIVALGRAAGNTLTAGGNDIIIGYNAQPSSVSVTNEITFGDTNVNRFRIPGIGLNATGTTGTGSFVLNTSPTLISPTLGVALGTSITTTSDSSFGGIPVGSGSGSITTNVRLGVSTLLANTTGSQNVALGYFALTANIGGSANTAVGTNSLNLLNTGSNNVGIGLGAGGNLTGGINDTLIGNGAVASGANVSNEITLGNASVTSFRIPGLGLTASGVTGTGSFVMGTSPVLVTPNLGTPSFITLTNATGLPISTGISGLGAGVATFLATANSTNLIAAMSGFTTGTGNVVFSTSPTLTTPNITDPKLHIAINPQVGTTYTFVLTDDGKLVTSTNASAQTFSIPTNASVAYPVGTQINIVQLGSAQITVNAVTPGTTSIISNASAPASPKTRVQYSSMTLIKLATDQWYVVGDIV